MNKPLQIMDYPILWGRPLENDLILMQPNCPHEHKKPYPSCIPLGSSDPERSQKASSEEVSTHGIFCVAHITVANWHWKKGWNQSPAPMYTWHTLPKCWGIASSGRPASLIFSRRATTQNSGPLWGSFCFHMILHVREISAICQPLII